MERRSEPRFQVHSPGKVTKLTTPETEIDCVLVDISATGMKLVADEGLPVDGQLCVEFESNLVLANVRHCQPRGTKFLVGVERLHTLTKLSLPIGATRFEKIQALIDDFHLRFNIEGSEVGCSGSLDIALAGGGFRATLFQLGSLWRMNEVGYLPKLDCVSSVSGGSITAGLLGVKWNQLDFDAAGKAANFEPLIVAPLRAFCAKNVDTAAVGEAALAPWKSVSDLIECEYRNYLFGDTTLQQLPDRPRFVFNATNLDTGVSFRFSKLNAGDCHIGLVPNPQFRVSLAVAASSAYPPVLSPVVVKYDPDLFQEVKGADLYNNDSHRDELLLGDGGLNDSFALEALSDHEGIILVSDAGPPFAFEELSDTSWTRQSMRALHIAINQAHARSKRVLISDYQQGRTKGAYWGITMPISEYGLNDSLPCPLQVTKALSDLRTRLNSFTEDEQCCLINWGYAICDAALRRWVGVRNQPFAAWPYPAFALDK
jgi:NTE family protein